MNHWLATLAVLLVALGGTGAALAEPGPATHPTGLVAKQKHKKSKKAKNQPVPVLRWSPRPSLRLGRAARADFKARMQSDVRGFSPAPGKPLAAFDFRRLRVGVEGNVLKDLDYEVEYELQARAHPWRDVFVNYRRFQQLQLQAGRFKIPLGEDQLISVSQLDFVYRSRIGANLAPGRDTGFMLHGRFGGRALAYQAGVFRGDGDISAGRYVEDAVESDRVPAGGRTVAARLVARPFRLLGREGPWDRWEFAFATAQSHLPEGLRSFRGRGVAGRTLFPLTYYVSGIRQRYSWGTNWKQGPFSIAGEVMAVRDSRLAQSLRGGDLPDLIARGWYVAGTWLVTGENKASPIKTAHPLIPHRGTGAVELAGRYESIRFGSAASGVPSRNPRAWAVSPNSDRVWTWGVNWYWNRHFKIQVNGVRESLEDPDRAWMPGRLRYWTFISRLQFTM